MFEQVNNPDPTSLEFRLDRNRAVAVGLPVEDRVEALKREVALIDSHLNRRPEQPRFAGEGYLDLLVPNPIEDACIAPALGSYLPRKHFDRAEQGDSSCGQRNQPRPPQPGGGQVFE